MKRKSLYLEIGNIDDDLIEEACEARGHRKSKINFARFVGAAACICIVCIASFSVLRKDSIYFNVADVSAALKVKIPTDENTTVLMPSYQELFEYYGIAQFPDELVDLHRVEQDSCFIYQNSDGIIYDTNVLQYASSDGKQTLSVTIAKEAFEVKMKDVKLSRINGVSLALAVSEEAAAGSSQPTYFAEISGQEVYLYIASRGMDESAFTDVIREIINLQDFG